MSKLQIAFAGTPDFAAAILEKLILSGHQIDVVFTQPDRRTGRGQKIIKSPVKELAIKHELPVFQPDSPAEITRLFDLKNIDVFIVVAYGMLLPESVLERPRFGCINVHASLLPRWRGAAPIQRAIQAGDNETGISIMQMDSGLDTGPVFAQARCKIENTDTAETIHNTLAEIGGNCLLEVLQKIQDGSAAALPQSENDATYANKIIKSEAFLDWNLSASTLDRTIRAFNPKPVAFTELNGVRLRIWQSVPIDNATGYPPGTIINCNKDGIDIATGNGALRLLKIQPQGKRVQTISEFLNGRPEFMNSLQQIQE